MYGSASTPGAGATFKFSQIQRYETAGRVGMFK
jgi:hypothetical protein